MRKFSLLISAALILQMYCFTQQAYAQDIKYDFSGIIYEQPSLFNIQNDNLLNPDNDILNFSSWTNRLYGRVALNLISKKFKFISQTRPTLFSEEGDTELDFFTDDAYVDLEVYQGYFIYIGKRNLRDVVAYGSNPTDFMGEDKEVDFTKREEERRVEREGNYLIGGEAYFSNITLSVAYAPTINDVQDEDDRFLLKGNLFAESINSDMSAHYFHGDLPGVGFDLSSTVSDNLVLHAEGAFRWGSNNKVISVVSEGNSTTPREFAITDKDDDDDIYANIVIGGSYTLGDGTNIILEYIYNGLGYSDDEWDTIDAFIKYNENAYRNNFFTGLATSNLAEANEIMNFRAMRKNYLFTRISNSTHFENVDGQLVFLINIDDGSFLTFPSVDYKLAENMIIGMSASVYAGEEDSEFGLLYWNSEASFVFKYYF